MTLAQRVRDHRYAKGWGPDELASRAAISRTALYQIESGKTEQPRAGTLRRIAQALEIPTESLLGPHLGLVGLPWTGQDQPAAPRASAEPSTARIRFDEPAGRSSDLERKFLELLATPLGEGLAKLVEESYRILPRSLAEARW
jgi:transcriptional regulator with XRE-family HTH domain